MPKVNEPLMFTFYCITVCLPLTSTDEGQCVMNEGIHLCPHLRKNIDRLTYLNGSLEGSAIITFFSHNIRDGFAQSKQQNLKIQTLIRG